MPKVLMIDDDVDLAQTVERWLVNEDHAFFKRHTGTEGIEELKTNDYDLIILDWHMPDILGIEVLKEFRRFNKVTPVIMLTGNTEIDAKEKGFDGGANDYLTKPFSLRELSARIKNVLRNMPKAPEKPKALGENNKDVLARANLDGTALAAKFEFLEVLGEGTWGVVFKARHPYLQKMVAIKMNQEIHMGEESTRIFNDEALAVSKLDHPNIVRVYDFGITESHQPYMVMEMVEGRNLDQMLEERSCAPVATAIDIISQICDGLSHAHAMKIVHRDLKPANIMLGPPVRGRYQVKILDFGVVLMLGDRESHVNEADEGIVGSPLYMAPEAVKGQPVDVRADIYACGVLLYEILTGNAPSGGETLEQLLWDIAQIPAAPLSEARPDLSFPDELQRVMDIVLAKDPGNRYQTAFQFQQALQIVGKNLADTRRPN